ncbi:MAG TPA: hypothetical protein VNW53_11720 [Phenylobacterium sp.]|uniref:hypothetical protein n=1 Tax=Phenylobacterium sp. TaxID=1871053 RepID=UPI002CFFEA09|nr:hypothetical protein [Phenylobacterium sp.]HXA39661.1 hypothetical protein [Phenylobacterium sp.]
MAATKSYPEKFEYAWCSKTKKKGCAEYQCMTCQPDGTWTEAKECKPGPDVKILPAPAPKGDH